MADTETKYAKTINVDGQTYVLMDEEARNNINVLTNNLSAKTYASDCNNIGEIGKLTIHSFDVNTLNTPYTSGLTGNTSSGIVCTFKSSSLYGVQMAFCTGSYNNRGYGFSRAFTGGEYKDWHPFTPYSKRETGITTDYGLTIDIIKENFTVALRIYGRLENVTSGNQVKLTTLAEEYCPTYSQGWNTYISQSGDGAPFLVRVDYTGEVYLNCTAAEQKLPTGYINIRYLYGIDY